VIYYEHSKKTISDLKGIFRIHTGFALVRIWSLNKTYPRKTNIHLFDVLRKLKQKREWSLHHDFISLRRL